MAIGGGEIIGITAMGMFLIKETFNYIKTKGNGKDNDHMKMDILNTERIQKMTQALVNIEKHTENTMNNTDHMKRAMESGRCPLGTKG